MNEPKDISPLSAYAVAPAAGWLRARVGFALCVAILGVLFLGPLLALFEFARNHDLYSHVLLMPFVSLYLVWTKPPARGVGEPKRAAGLTVGLVLVGLLPLLVLWAAPRWWGWEIKPQDFLFLSISSFVLLTIASALVFFGQKTIASISMALAMLLFMAPFPTVAEGAVEAFFQHASAEATAILFRLAGTPVVRDGLVFDLPRIQIVVGPECSGVRSTLVLFITSLVAGFLFLRNPWSRAALAFAVIPLAILRNGFRIFVIGMLCVHIDPSMIHSWVHRRGGPLFFLLSLVPFFLILVLLRRAEERRRTETGGGAACGAAPE